MQQRNTGAPRSARRPVSRQEQLRSEAGERRTSSKYSKRRKRLIRHRRRLFAAIAAVFFLIIGGILLFLNIHPLFLKQELIRHEMTEVFDPADNIRFVFGGKVSDVKVEGSVDVSVPGDYKLTYIYGKVSRKVTVRVQDTTPPELLLKTCITDLAEEIKPELFIDQVKDAAETIISFEESGDWSKEGDYEVRIAAEDASGNRTVETTKLIRKRDSTGPEIQGTEDISVIQGKEADLAEGISVTDDLDPAPQFEMDLKDVDLNTPGTYKAVCIAKDRSGNETRAERTVIVKEDPEYGKKIVYLTFDDGPSENTRKILDILKKYNVKGTFFVTGNHREHDDLMKRAYDEGHAIGLHTYTHDYAEVYSSKDAYYKDLNKISDLVENVTGEKSYLIRFPGGSSNTVSAKYTKGLMTELVKEVRDKGYQYFDWNCDSTDASGNNVPADKLVANATSSQADHINILMHDTDAKDTTVEALPKIIEYYKAKGYVFMGLTVDSFEVHHSVNN